MTRVVLNQMAAQWATFRRPRSFLGSVGAAILAIGVILVAIAVLAVVAVIAIPAGLAFGAIWWVRRRIPRVVAQVRGDGRRNVRVIGGPASADP